MAKILSKPQINNKLKESTNVRFDTKIALYTTTPHPTSQTKPMKYLNIAPSSLNPTLFPRVGGLNLTFQKVLDSVRG